mgnify:CR=1 FL=1
MEALFFFGKASIFLKKVCTHHHYYPAHNHNILDSSMPSSTTPSFNDVDVNAFVYKSIKMGSSTGIVINANDDADTRTGPVVMLPRMTAPFGVRDKREDASEWARRTIELNCPEDTFSDLHTWMATFDTRTCTELASRCQELLATKKAYSVERIDEMFRSSIQPTDGDFPPLLRVKASENGTNRTTVYICLDEEQQRFKKGTLDDIGNRWALQPIVEIKGVWKSAAGMGHTFVCKVIIAYPPTQPVAHTIHSVPGLENAQIVTDEEGVEDKNQSLSQEEENCESVDGCENGQCVEEEGQVLHERPPVCEEPSNKRMRPNDDVFE